MNNLLSIYGDLQYRHIGYELEGDDSDLNSVTQSHYFNFFNPKAGVFLTLDEKNTAHASFAIGNREPTRSDYKEAMERRQ